MRKWRGKRFEHLDSAALSNGAVAGSFWRENRTSSDAAMGKFDGHWSGIDAHRNPVGPFLNSHARPFILPFCFASINLNFSLQQDDTERPLKRYGSSQSSDTSPECRLSPQYNTSCSSIPLSTDDEKESPENRRKDKTYTISTGDAKEGECSATIVVSQRDSQTVYSSSFKSNVNSKSKLVQAEAVPSPAESNGGSEAAEFDAIGDSNRVGFMSSPANDYLNMFSPLEERKLTEENKILISKGEKTPHTLKKRPANLICYK